MRRDVTGLDFFPGFIDRFNADARRLHLADRVKGVVGSMDALPFRAGELDLIWSEGAIYNIGFERGLNEWREYLKPGGYLAVSESVWFTDERPTEIHDFWVDAYPEIDTIPNKVAQIHRAGYRGLRPAGDLLDGTLFRAAGQGAGAVRGEISGGQHRRRADGVPAL